MFFFLNKIYGIIFYRQINKIQGRIIPIIIKELFLIRTKQKGPGKIPKLLRLNDKLNCLSVNKDHRFDNLL